MVSKMMVKSVQQVMYVIGLMIHIVSTRFLVRVAINEKSRRLNYGN